MFKPPILQITPFTPSHYILQRVYGGVSGNRPAAKSDTAPKYLTPYSNIWGETQKSMCVLDGVELRVEGGGRVVWEEGEQDSSEHCHIQ